MERIFQVAAWLLALAIVVLSLSPPSVRPITDAAHDVEHLIIFLATGAAFGFGYANRFWLLAITMLTFAAAIEVAQIWVPGRHARMSDFIVDAAASCLGVGLSFAISKIKRWVSEGERSYRHRLAGFLTRRSESTSSEAADCSHDGLPLSRVSGGSQSVAK
jgi:VanZ family protein